MPSGIFNDPMLKFCKICKKKLRPLNKNDDFPERKYHISCWKTLLSDIKHYQKRAYTKFNHKRLVAGVTEEEARERLKNGEKIIMRFD